MSKSCLITGMDAEEASARSILDGKQSMTVFKDVRTLVQTAVDAAVALLKGQAPAVNGSYNNGALDVPALQSAVVSVDKANVKATLIDSGYYAGASEASASRAPAPSGNPVVGVVLPTQDEPRWIQDQKRFQDAFRAAGYNVEILFSQGDAAKRKRTSKRC